MSHTVGKGFFAMLLVAIVFMVMYASATLPSPLYPLYRKAFGFSGLILTVIYAVYVLGNLISLLILGRLSDQIGRRVVILSAIGLAIAGTLLFIFAHGTFWLFPARVLCGLATALAIGTVIAWLTELHPHRDKAYGAMAAILANMCGLALGAILSGALATFAPWPLRLPWLVYLGMLVAAGILALFVPETLPGKSLQWSALSLRPRVGVPKELWLPFIAPAVTAFAAFALFGFYFAVVPGLLGKSLHLMAPVVAGEVLLELGVVSAIVAVTTRKLASRRAMFTGIALLPPSLALLLLAETLHALPLLFGATALAGIAGTLGYRGSLEVVNEFAPDNRRSEIVSSYTVFCYVGNAVPIIGIGVLEIWIASLIAHIVFAVVVALLALGAFVTAISSQNVHGHEGASSKMRVG